MFMDWVNMAYSGSANVVRSSLSIFGCMDWVNMAYSGSANVVRSSLSIFGCMPSGPGDLLGFNLSSFLATSQIVKTMLSISLTGCCAGCSGILVMSSWVNTDVNCLAH